MPVFVGDLDPSTMKFNIEASSIYDSVGSYAQRTLVDGKGRRISHTWILEDRAQALQEQQGWSGALSIPRELYLINDNQVGVRSAAELLQLRTRKLLQTTAKLGQNGFLVLNTSCKICEIEASITIVAQGI
jgi:beta-fructofuranosidase